MSESDAALLWKEVQDRLASKLSSDGFDTWIAPTKGLSMKNGILLVEVPNSFFSDWITEYYGKEIREALVEMGKGGVKVSFKSASPVKRPLISKNKRKTIYSGDGTKLLSRYTFENFIVGESNRFAHAAAWAVAEAPAEAYNPLFVYGGAGLGKTHLIQAIGNHLKAKSNFKVYYTPAENIFIELIEAIRKDERMEFKYKYRSKDLLLIDDIHYLKGKESLQEEIFHIFNYLYDAGKQIVITSDRPPKEIPTLEERLSSRFQGGLVVDIQPPDLEMRMAILHKKSEIEGYKLPQDVAYYISSKVRSNIRELEGALIKLLAKASVDGTEPNLGLATEVLKDLVKEDNRISKEEVIRLVAKEFGITVAEIKSKRRTKEVALARQLAMYLLRNQLGLSLKEVGECFGGKDHTTVIHACERVGFLKESNTNFTNKLKELINRIRRE